MKTRRVQFGAMALGLVLALSGTLEAQEAGTWQFRGKALGIFPDAEVVIGGSTLELDVSNAYVPQLDITYFASPMFAFELILATAKHDVEVVGTAALGSVWLLPPTLSLQFHPLPDEKFQPYVGVGGNMTLFYNLDVPSGLDVDYETAFGFALQAGADVPFGYGPWLLNVDVKKLFLSTDVTVNPGSLAADAQIDPWVVSAGVVYRLPS